MPFDRKAIKYHAKELMRETQPAVWGITLVYLLATVWVSNLAGLLNPVSRQINSINAAMQEAYMTMDENAVVSTMYQMQALSKTPGFRVTILISVLIGLYSLVVNFGYIGYTLRVVREGTGETADLFDRFYMAGKIIGAELLMGLFVFLWSLLFVIPGLIAIYRYAMIPYILLDDPDCSIMEAFRRSKAIMNGRKGEFFVLSLSFMGWLIGASVLVNLAAMYLPGETIATVGSLVISTA
jgi:uncharacterized membrane protein